MRLAYVTNNALRTPDVVAEHLTELGIPTGASDVITSAQAAARLISEQVPAGARVLVIGGEGLRVALRERGLEPVESADDDPAAVVQGSVARICLGGASRRRATPSRAGFRGSRPTPI